MLAEIFFSGRAKKDNIILASRTMKDLKILLISYMDAAEEEPPPPRPGPSQGVNS